MTNKIRVVLECNSHSMFEWLQEARGDCAPLGCRIASLLMTGEASFSDLVVLKAHGIDVISCDNLGAKDDDHRRRG